MANTDQTLFWLQGKQTNRLDSEESRFLRYTKYDLANFKEPALEDTLKYINCNSLNDQRDQSLIADNIGLAKYGLGLFLYFQLIRRAAYMMFVLSAVYLVSLLCNSSGNGLDTYGEMRSLLLRSSIANQNQLLQLQSSGSADILAINANLYRSWVNQAGFNYLLVAIPDLICSILFIAFYFSWTKFVSHTKASYALQYPTPSKFTVTVQTEQLATAAQIHSHFQNFGPIIEVKTCEGYTEFLNKFKAIGQLASEIKMQAKLVEIRKGKGEQTLELEANIQGNRDKLKDLLTQAKVIIAGHREELKPLFYFVKFRYTNDSFKTLMMFGKYSNFNLIEKYLCCCCLPTLPEHFKFKGAPIKISRCEDEPESLKWQNLKVSTSEKVFRGVLMYSLIVLSLFLAFLAIFVISLFTPATTTSSNLNYTPTLAQAQTISTREVWDLYCFSLPAKDMLSEASLKFCSDSFSRYGLQWLLNTCVAIGTVVINTVLAILVKQFGKLRRASSKNQELSINSSSLFLATLLNSVIMTVFLQSSIFGFSATKSTVDLLQTTDAKGFISSLAVYSDLNRAWYVDVGAKITSFWIVSTFSPHCITLLLLPLIKCWRRRKFQNAELQIEANQYSLGSSFPVEDIYAEILNTVAVSFVFAAAMPHLVLMGAVALLLKYYIYKYLLLNYYRRPPTLNHQLAQLTYKIFPSLIVLHLMFSIWILGVPSIFPPQSSPFYGIASSYLGGTGVSSIFSNNSSVQQIYKRSLANAAHLLLLALILTYYLAKLVALTFLKVLASIFCGGREEQASLKMDFQVIRGKLSERMEVSYDISCNQQYRESVNSIQAIIASGK